MAKATMGTSGKTLPVPPPMPPEILAEELIAHAEIAVIHGPHSEGTHEVIAAAGSTSAPA